jgi:hypothetical protein
MPIPDGPYGRFDKDGVPVATIPLVGTDRRAKVTHEDFLRLKAAGLEWLWNRSGNANKGRGYVTVRATLDGQRFTVVVARLILEAPPNMRVKYRDENSFNLRRDNLYLHPTARKPVPRDMRGLLPPLTEEAKAEIARVIEARKARQARPTADVPPGAHGESA